MTPTGHSPAEYKTLIGLLSRSERLLDDVLVGGYDSDELLELRSITEEAKKLLHVPEERLAEEASVSLAVIRNVIGGGRPRLQNFLAIATGLRECIVLDMIYRGLVSKSYLVDGDAKIRFAQFTATGALQSLVFELEEFQRVLVQSNDPDVYVSQDVREALVEALEAILLELRGKAVRTKSIAAISKALKRFSGSVASKTSDHAAETAASSIVSTILRVFGIS